MIRFAKTILSAGLNGLALGLLTLPATAARPVVMPTTLPLYFEANQGQADVPAPFIARGHEYQFLISPAEARMALHKAGAETAVVRMQFVGANTGAQIRGDAKLPGKINYLTGSNPAQWHTDVATFARVRIEGLYPGVSLVYYGNQQQLEYDFTVAPGASPQAIVMHFDGVDEISVNPQGELILKLAGGEIRQPKPVIYQLIGGARREIAGGYRLVDARTVAFTVGQYDRSQPLVIDPLLSYSTYFGGTAGDAAWAVAVDTADTNGFVYVAGQTFSQKFYTNVTGGFSTVGAFQQNFAGGNLTGDAFVAKFDNSASSLIYLTYLGGSADDGAYAVAVDASGHAYVTGFTDSPDFPVTTNALYKTISGVFDKSYGYYPIDAFVTELSPDGSSLVYSTYLGGSSMDCGLGIAVDAATNTYVTGFTYSSNFPTVNALQSKLACTNTFYFNANAFIAKIGPGGSPLVYSTYFGGTNYEQGRGIAVDTNGFVYVAGFTASTNFPTTNYIRQLIGSQMVDGHVLNEETNKNKNNLSYDAFVAKFDPTGTNLVYSTLLGSTNSDVADGIAVDNNGAAYVTGWTVSSNFPSTFGTNIYSYLATNTRAGYPATNVFLTKITNAIGTTNVGIAWSALFGGKGVDMGNGVALDPAGSNVFVTGSASSTNFPRFNVPPFLSYTNSGKSDAFVIAFSAAGTNLYSTYLGGKENDYGYGIAADSNGNAYVVGQTLSTNFPTYSGTQTHLNGTNDAFLAEIMLMVPAPTITTQPLSQSNQVGTTITFDINGTAYSPYLIQWQDGTNLVSGTNLVDARNISGATNVTLTITNAQTTNGDLYYQVIVTNYGGAVTSAAAFLLITNVPPAITQPTNQIVGVGTTASLAVTVTNGTAPLSCQWWNGTNLLKNGGQISGANTTNLTITGVQLTNDGSYFIIVTNIAGAVTSSVVTLTVQAFPLITVQPTPTNLSMAVGSTATFAITAVGTVPLKYQWWEGTNQVRNGAVTNGPAITGAFTNVLKITNTQTTNSGNYTVVVTNIAGSVTSSVVALLVTNVPPAIITVQPTNQFVGVGTTATLAVTATGTAPLKYQWQVNGTNLVNGSQTNGPAISGVTSNVLTIGKVQLANSSSNYTVIVTNIAGAVTSSVVTLTVQASPVITLQPTPTNQSMAVGSAAIYSVAAVGTVPLSYRWLVNGTNLVNGGGISGATTTNLTISPAQTTNSGNYTVVITNIAGSVTSSVVALLVTNVPAGITVQPTNQSVAVGGTVTLVVTAIGTAPLSYQWWNGTNLVKNINIRNGPTITGANIALLRISNAQITNSGSYTVVVMNIAGSVTSSVAVLTVASSPVIVSQPTPTNQVMGVASTATFTVSAAGIAPLSYQWRVNGTNLVEGSQTNGSTISGSTNSFLQISNVQTNDSGSYSVIVRNSAGSATSSNAVLTVTNTATVLTQQPASQTVAVGATVSFSVSGYAQSPYFLQWLKDGVTLVDETNLSGSIITGSTNIPLTISNVQTNDSGTYWLVITTPWGTLASSNAVLTVLAAPLFGSIVAAPGGGGFVLSGTGGTNGGTYYVLTSSNLLAPLDIWTPIATNQFDSQGDFIFTNTAQTNAPQMFFILQMP